MQRKTRNYIIIYLLMISIINLSCEDRMYVPGPEDEKQQYAGIEIIVPTTYLYTGGNIQAKLFILLDSGSRIEADNADVAWETGDSDILYVSNDGYIEAKKEGTASVIASAANFAVSEEISVADHSKILLNEVYYDPPGEEDRGEYISIFNYNKSSCDLSGFSLVCGNGKSVFIFPSGSIVNADSAVIAAGSFEGFYEEFGFLPDYYNIAEPLNNDGETVFLLLPDGNINDCVYIEGGSADYPAGEDWGSTGLPSCAEGESVSRTGPLDSDSYSDWAAGPPILMK